MKCIGIIQTALLAVLAIEGGMLLMQNSGDVMAPSAPGAECSYNYVLLNVTEDIEGTSADELLKGHAAIKQKVSEIFSKSGATFHLDSEDTSIIASPSLDDGEHEAGLLGSIASAMKPSPTQLRLSGTVQYRFDAVDKAAEMLKQLSTANLTTELRIEQGDTCKASVKTETPKKEQ